MQLARLSLSAKQRQILFQGDLHLVIGGQSTTLRQAQLAHRPLLGGTIAQPLFGNQAGADLRNFVFDGIHGAALCTGTQERAYDLCRVTQVAFRE